MEICFLTELLGPESCPNSLDDDEPHPNCVNSVAGSFKNLVTSFVFLCVRAKNASFGCPLHVVEILSKTLATPMHLVLRTLLCVTSLL